MSGSSQTATGADAAAIEERYRRLFQYSNDAILILDVEGRVVDANRQAVRLFGYPREELLGLRSEQLQSPDATPNDRRTLTGGGAILTEIEFRSRSGRVFPAEVSVSVLPLPDGAWIQTAIRDISERRLAERLAVERAALERANRELDEFASIAAHDMQEPLRKVQAFAERLAARVGGSLDEASGEDLRRLRAATVRLQRLVEGLLEYARLPADEEIFPPVDLGEVARETLADLAVAIEATGAEIEVGPLPTLEADRLQMGQLLANLVGNALKFHPAGEPPRVRISAAPAREEGVEVCRLTVVDDGIGFDPAQLATILKPFRRLHGRGEFDGSGLGLAVCQKIAARHGGRIAVESAPGRGAAFTVTLPLRSKRGG